MRISEMTGREDYQTILVETLRSDWAVQHGLDVSIVFDAEAPGQAWCVQPWLSAYYTPDVNRRARRFLADHVRYTRVRSRVVPQMVLGTTVASWAGLKLSGQVAFRVSPAIPNARATLILPGNQRLRFFDFERGITRVVLKKGFHPSSMNTEIAVRGSGEVGPYPPITRHSGDARWFEEPVLEGYTLARCPPWLPARRLELRALDALEAWAAARSELRPAEPYVRGLEEKVEVFVATLERRFALRDTVAAALVLLAPLAMELGQIPVGPSHGDCQAGNILIQRDGQHTTFIDWEFYGLRSRWYDRLVLGLGARWPGGLGERVRAFVGGHARGSVLAALRLELMWRRRVCALFLLEELVWCLGAAAAGPFAAPPENLAILLGELSGLHLP